MGIRVGCGRKIKGKDGLGAGRDSLKLELGLRGMMRTSSSLVLLAPLGVGRF